MPEYITISAFAERAGVTRQAVYLRLDKDLAQYCKELDGKKKIDIAALSLYGCQSDPSSDNQENDKCKASDDKSTSDFTDYLREELSHSRQQIADKDALLAEKDALLASYTDRFAALAEREQEISARALQTTGQAQALHAGDQERDVENNTIHAEPGKRVDTHDKKGFFAKLFG